MPRLMLFCLGREPHAAYMKVRRTLVQDLGLACVLLAAWAMVSLTGCGGLWLRAEDRIPLVDERNKIVLAADGGSHVAASEANCIKNRCILQPVMDRQAYRVNLNIPSLDVWKAELWDMQKQRLTAQSASCKRGHKLKPVSVTSAKIECSVHLDAKALKRMMSFMRYRFLKGNYCI